VTETQADDLTGGVTTTSRRTRWQAVVGLLGLAGLAVAVATTVDDVQGKALPGPGALTASLGLSAMALICAGAGWAALFPPEADRQALVSALYTSQLTKYLPAGGFLQVASQVTLAGQTSGIVAAAVRLPVYSMCTVCAGATLGSLLALNDTLPVWSRVLAGLGLLSPVLLDRRLLSWVLDQARRFVHRVPSADELPAQRQIVRCYVYSLGTLAAYAAAFTFLIGDLADVRPVAAAAALCIAWVIGYLVIPVPSGIGVREAILVAALPGVGTGQLLAASLAHRLLAVVTETVLAATSVVRVKRSQAAARDRVTRP
jgi:hypothetical protein